MARTAGFDDLNLDLIYGLPNQTLESWESSLQAALAPEARTPQPLLLNNRTRHTCAPLAA